LDEGRRALTSNQPIVLDAALLSLDNNNNFDEER